MNTAVEVRYGAVRCDQVCCGKAVWVCLVGAVFGWLSLGMARHGRHGEVVLVEAVSGKQW